MKSTADTGIKYAAIRDRNERLAFMRRMAQNQESLTIDLVDDLLCLDLGTEESAALVGIVGGDDSLAVEDFITRHFMRWEQDISLSAIARWMTTTDRLLSHRWLCFNTLTELPQRLRYSFVSHCDKFGGEGLLRINADLPKLSEFSPAFISLLLLRCSQWSIRSEKLIQIAESIIMGYPSSTHHDRMLSEALTYIATIEPKRFDKYSDSVAFKEPWGSISKAIGAGIENAQRTIKDWQKSLTKEPAFKKVVSHWPTICIRQFLTADQVKEALKVIAGLSTNKPGPQMAFTSNDLSLPISLLAGVPANILVDAFCSVTETETIAAVSSAVEVLLKPGQRSQFVGHLKKIAAQNSKLLDQLPKSISLEVFGRTKDATPDPAAVTRWMDERQKILHADPLTFETTGPQHWRYSGTATSARSADENERRLFFDIAYRNRSVHAASSGFWSLMAAAWSSPQLNQLDELAALARKASPLFQLAYINTLGRFKGIDAAVLKLLDFVRSPHDAEIQAVIRALAGIGTPRALQELVSCLTRPNLNVQLRLEAAQLLSRHDLSSVQDELRSALADLHLTKVAGTDAEKQELKEALEALVVPSSPGRAPVIAANSPVDSDVRKLDLDIALSEKIPNFQSMSSEVKRALRAAEFFHQQVNQSKAENSIDLSPLIDMQYKALELTFREQFEDPCNRIINQGVIQRKLDLLGYARPIPAQMDQFEGFIAGLPTYNTIPYFSKFKMRKMLRSLCQFRPGKRFTLDGLKAFAIFFACFSRKNCRFGLENIFELPFKTDEETAQFVKMLHVFQDFRNRAAHEGFQPDAKNDVAGIWQSTAEIFAKAQVVDAFLRQANAANRRSTVNRAS